jgi:NAD(P)H-dependent FMN reductase
MYQGLTTVTNWWIDDLAVGHCGSAAVDADLRVAGELKVTVRILGICGSLQAQSANLALLHSAVASAQEGVEMTIFDGLRDLPLFNPDLEAAAHQPPAVGVWRRALSESDALLIVCPEYGFSMPGALKNGVDWVIGSGELERKVIGVTASVNHPDRGRGGLKALSDTLTAVSARLVGGRAIVRGPGLDREVAALVQALIKEVAAGEEAPEHGLGLTVRPGDVVRAWVEAFNRGDVDRLASFYALDATNHQVAETPVEGRDAIRKMFADGFATATMTCVVENLFEDREWAILEWRDPKGLRGCGFFQMKNGLIVFQRGYWDKLSFLRQQGLPLPKE